MTHLWAGQIGTIIKGGRNTDWSYLLDYSGGKCFTEVCSVSPILENYLNIRRRKIGRWEETARLTIISKIYKVPQGEVLKHLKLSEKWSNSQHRYTSTHKIRGYRGATTWNARWNFKFEKIVKRSRKVGHAQEGGSTFQHQYIKRHQYSK